MSNRFWTAVLLAELAFVGYAITLDHCASVDARRAKDDCRLRGGKVKGGKEWTCSFGPCLRVDLESMSEP